MQITSLLTKEQKPKPKPKKQIRTNDTDFCVLCGLETNIKNGMYLYGKFICNECAFKIAEAISYELEPKGFK